MAARNEPLPLYVFADVRTRADADAVRRAFGGKARVLDVRGHTAGQTIPGNAVVVGDSATTLEQDVAGRVERYSSLEAALQARAPKPPAPPMAETQAPAAVPTTEPPVRHVRGDRPAMADRIEGTRTWPEQAKPDTPAPPQDDLESKSRQELIKIGAKQYPGQRNWALLSEAKLREELRELRGQG